MGNGIGSNVLAAVLLAAAIGAAAWAVKEQAASSTLTEQLAAATADAADAKALLDTANRNAEQMRDQLTQETAELATAHSQLQASNSRLASSAAAARASAEQVRAAEARLAASAAAAKASAASAKAAAAQAQAAEAKLAQEARPDLPVRIGFRRGVLGGVVMVLQNFSAKSLEVQLELQTPSTQAHAQKSVMLDPNKVQRLGKVEGWEFTPGQIVHLSNPEFRPIQKTVDAI